MRWYLVYRGFRTEQRDFRRVPALDHPRPWPSPPPRRKGPRGA